LIWNVDCIGIK